MSDDNVLKLTVSSRRQAEYTRELGTAAEESLELAHFLTQLAFCGEDREFPVPPPLYMHQAAVLAEHPELRYQLIQLLQQRF